MGVVRLDVVGVPAPQGSKRHVGHGVMVESSRQVGPWREVVAATAAGAGVAPFVTPVFVDLKFRLRRPQRPRWSSHGTKPDLDKLIRSTLDGLVIGGLLADDALVCVLTAGKFYATAAQGSGCAIEVVALPPGDARQRKGCV